MVDSQNMRPLFLPNQLSLALRATHLLNPKPTQEFIMDLATLIQDVIDMLPWDLLVSKFLGMSLTKLPPPWSKDKNGWLSYQGRLYVPDAPDLCLRVLRTFHDHILAGHPGQTKTQQLIRREFTWPKMKSFVVDFVKSCNACSRNKSK